MPLVRSLIGYDRQTNAPAATSSVIGPFTPPANSILVARGGGSTDYVSADTSGSLHVTDDAGLVWTEAGNSFSPTSFAISEKVWTAPVGPSPGPMSVTISVADDYGGSGHECFSADLLAYVGADPLAPVRQVKAYDQPSGDSVVPPTILDMAPLLSSEVLSYLIADTDDDGNGLAGAGFVDVLNPPSRGNASIEARTGSASATVAWASVSDGNVYFFKYCTLAVEIAAAADLVKGLMIPNFVPGF